MEKGEVLYHYTSIAGLNDIIRSRTLRASDCRYLNDQNELVHAINIFLSRFEGTTKEILSLALQVHSMSRAHCVFSLSRSPRVLSQWRAYGDDGRGAAIGFWRQFLPLPDFERTNACVLVDCIYDNHEGFIDSVIERCNQDTQALLKMYSDASGAVNSFLSLIDNDPMPLVRLYAELLKVKNPAFSEEQEVRLVISAPLSQVQTRVRNGLIIPYVDHAFIEADERHLWYVAPEIWLGPRSDKRNMQALRFFEQLGWHIKGIRHFDCGYI